MAPISALKRYRNDTEELYGDSRSEQLIAQPGQRKRPRYSTVTTDGDSPTVTPEPSAINSHGFGQSSYRDLRNVDDSDDEDDESARPMGTSAMTQNMENQASDHAIIEEVICINFMCHAHLQVQLGPLINFIIGHNGSGKSAVLTAITLCLGGKATATNRGQNLKSFITEGKESCTLSVKLKNQGPSAYKFDEYGPSIIVERHFSRVGSSSGFKMRSATKKIVSTRKSDLDDLLEAWSLQLDNPMNVLTQDQARQFLNKSDPGHKYRFFMTGTQLTALDNAYRYLDELLDKIESNLSGLKEGLLEKREKYDETQKRVEIARKQKGLEGQIQELIAQCAWCQVEQQEAELDVKDEEVRSAKEEVTRREYDKVAAEEKSQNAAGAHERAEAACASVQNDLGPIEDQLKEAKAQFDENRESIQNLMHEQRTIQGDMKVDKKRQTVLQDQIRDEQAKISGVNGDQNSSKIQQLEDAREAHRQAEDARHSHTKQQVSLRATREQAEKALVEGRAQVEAQREARNHCQNALQKLQKAQGDWKAAYDRNLPSLLKAISNEPRFRKKPVGPFGRHIRLLRDDWSKIIELSLGNVLNSFVVTNRTDQLLLTDIMHRTKCVVPVLITGENPIDTSPNEPAPDLVTVKRVLEIDDPLVFKSLVINQNIEQLVLIKKRDAAMTFMFDGNRPAKVIACICQQDKVRDTDPDAGLRLSFSASGAMSSTPIKLPQNVTTHPPPRMKGNDELRIRAQQQELQEKSNGVDESERSKRQLEDCLDRAKQAIFRHQREAKDHTATVQGAEDLVHQLQNELEEQAPNAGHLESLQEELREVENIVKMSEESFKNSVNERDKLNEKARELKDLMDVAQGDFDEHETRLKKAEANVTRLDNQRLIAIQETNVAVQNIGIAQNRLEETEAAREQQMVQVNDFIRQASTVCGRVVVPAGKTYKSLEMKLKELQKQQEMAANQLGMSYEELVDLALRQQEDYRSRRKNLQSHTIFHHKLGSSLAVRQDRWKKFRKFIRLRAVNVFAYLLSERDFRGHLDISHSEQTLKIRIEPDITKTTDKGRQTATLSGGEKSFSTICLLIALWDAMGSPIRCLDEFDVFMDNVNRDVSMKMIIRAARRSVGRQFIFITPQSMSSVALDQDVKIIKMNDPERGQSTLNFAR